MLMRQSRYMRLWKSAQAQGPKLLHDFSVCLVVLGVSGALGTTSRCPIQTILLGLLLLVLSVYLANQRA